MQQGWSSAPRPGGQKLLSSVTKTGGRLHAAKVSSLLVPPVLTLLPLAMTLGLKLGADRCQSGLDES